MLSDTPLRREPYEEGRASTTTHAHSRVTAPTMSSDTLRYTISNEGIHLPRPEPTQASRLDNDSPVPQAPPVRRTVESANDTMDVDQDQLDQDSDNDTEQGDPTSAARKKKGQRFFCTGYPPCSLSFTRSEHLARHIRKHTGERPFQCHCNRRFSRLDNLRQHAQTVHVNEEIPTDSLAATGTRFQRQIRTDRVRPAGRPRTSTMSSSGSHSRGHSRNLSASSVGSTSSNYSTSTIDPRRRPPPLIMAGDGRPKLSLDNPSTPPAQFSSYATHSPNDITTPASATFSLGEGSPGFGSMNGSPLVTGHRGGFFGGQSAPARRLSVPSGVNAYQPPYSGSYTPSYGSQSGVSSASISNNPSAVVSPTSSTFSFGPGFHVPTGEEWRRRTWHPSTYASTNFSYSRPATSGLTYSQTPDAPQPAFAHHATAAAGHAPRLPGIESFDHVQQQPNTPPRQNVPPMTSNAPNSSTLMPPAEIEPHAPRVQASSDTLRQSTYPEREDAAASDRTSTSWVQETIDQIQMLHQSGAKRNVEITRHLMGPPPPTSTGHPNAMQDASQPQPNNNRSKRNGWYNGPLPAPRTSPEDSSSSEGIPTPGTSSADVQPAIMHSNGVVEPQHTLVSVDGGNNVREIHRLGRSPH
jgi:hypothetical protein